jgi:hypothetical protein
MIIERLLVLRLTVDAAPLSPRFLIVLFQREKKWRRAKSRKQNNHPCAGRTHTQHTATPAHVFFSSVLKVGDFTIKNDTNKK